MNKIKKAASTLLTVLLSMTFVLGQGTVLAGAAEPQPVPVVAAQIDQEDSSAVYFEPRYTNISSIAAGLAATLSQGSLEVTFRID